MNNRNLIINIIRISLSYITGTFFLCGSLGYIINPLDNYPNYMYLCCAIFFLLSSVFESIVIIYEIYNCIKNKKLNS